MRNKSVTIWVMVAVLVIIEGQGFGLEFRDGGTHNIDYVIYDSVVVDYQSPGMQTTVNLLGGRIDSHDLVGCNDSRINIAGGWVDDYLYAYDNSQVTMISGGVGECLYAYDNSQLMMTGGHVNCHLYAYDNSQVTITDGQVNWDLYATGTSQVAITGGQVNGALFAYDNSQVTMSSGGVGRYLYAAYNSQINWSGGTIGDDIQLMQRAILALDGSNFAIDGTPFVSGQITSIFGGYYGNESYRTLTGILSNGDIINDQFRIGDDAKIVLTPELTTLLVQTEPNDINTVTPSIGQHICSGWVDINATRFIDCPRVYNFDHWDGDVEDANSANTRVFMNSDKTITAVFRDNRQCGDECHPYPAGDISKDCKVDFLDIALVADSWLECTQPECD